MKQLHAILAGILLVATSPAVAHGNETHPERGAPVLKDQKAWGIAGDRESVTRTIDIRMLDSMRFVPDRVEIRQGETIRLRISNAGQAMHEYVLGTRQDLEKHAEMMKRFPNMEHDEPYMAHVAPGKKGEIIWTFNRTGEFDFACLLPGHYEAGMTGKLRVGAK